MLAHDALTKDFNPQQQKDIIDLDRLCMNTPVGRIRKQRVRKLDPNHIPRPINSFMAYRTEKQALVRKYCPTANHRYISKIVAKWWRDSSSEEKAVYVWKAKTAKEEHTKKYPGYTFRPKPKRTKSAAEAPMIEAQKPAPIQRNRKQRLSVKSCGTQQDDDNRHLQNMFFDNALFDSSMLRDTSINDYAMNSAGITQLIPPLSAVHNYYYQPTFDYFPRSLNTTGLKYADPKHLTYQSMAQSNSHGASIIPYGALDAKTLGTPCLKTPSLDYFESPPQSLNTTEFTYADPKYMTYQPMESLQAQSNSHGASIIPCNALDAKVVRPPCLRTPSLDYFESPITSQHHDCLSTSLQDTPLLDTNVPSAYTYELCRNMFGDFSNSMTL